MFRHLLILPDGSELFSGSDTQNAIVGVTVTELVNDNHELMPGSVCAACMEARLLTPEGGLSLTAEDPVILYRVDEAGARQQMGIFYLEKPTRTGSHTMTLTGYDAVCKTDLDLTDWLAGLDQWPYSVGEFAHMVCAQCGLTLEDTELPNADHFISPFAAEAVTGRKLLQWLGQVTGRFCHATPQGQLRFDWYRPNTALTVAPTGQVGATYYFQDSLRFEDYTVAPVEKVQIRQSSEDIGTIFPDEAGSKNTYIIENNPMLPAADSTSLLTVAQTLYQQMSRVTYTPGRVSIPAEANVRPGDILSVTNSNGRTVSMYVMKLVCDGLTATIECTGSHRRNSSSAVHNLGFRALEGKVLNLRTDVDGLKAENKNTSGALASLNLDLNGIRSRVENQDASTQDALKQLSALTQRADGLSLELTELRQNGAQKVQTSTGYTFDDQGLHISRSDSQMANTLDHTGMYVKRYGQVILQANHQGVEATDVTVRNYLVVGEHARLEDYGTDRTACYYIS